jgi:hypothetical protein
LAVEEVTPPGSRLGNEREGQRPLRLDHQARFQVQANPGLAGTVGEAQQRRGQRASMRAGRLVAEARILEQGGAGIEHTRHAAEVDPRSHGAALAGHDHLLVAGSSRLYVVQRL